MIVRTQLNNLHGIPTDCPQREKIGWTADGCITMEEAIYNFNMATFYTKWFHDMLDAQDANGHAALYCTESGLGAVAARWFARCALRSLVGRRDRPHALATLPLLWRPAHPGRGLRGHDQVPGLCWPSRAEPHRLGKRRRLAGSGRQRRTFTANASRPWPARPSTSTTRKPSARSPPFSAKPTTPKSTPTLSAAISQSFHRQYFNPVTGLYAKDSQTAQALPLCFGMTPADKRPLVLEQLVKNIKETRKSHVSSGIVGTLYVFQSLMESGRDDLAYAMIAQEDFPSWGHMLRNGATTTWESWDGGGSRNHPALGCIGAWFFQALAGIRPDPSSPGFKHIVISPAVVGDLTWAKARYQSGYGPIASQWKRQGDTLVVSVTIPPNTTATVFVPTKDAAHRDRRRRTCRAGQWCETAECRQWKGRICRWIWALSLCCARPTELTVPSQPFLSSLEAPPFLDAVVMRGHRQGNPRTVSLKA